MEPNNGRKRTNKIVGGVVMVLLVASAGLFTAVSAQTGPSSSCSGDVVTEFGTEFFGFGPGRDEVAVFSTGPTTRVFDLAAPLTAGEYALAAVSYDGYPGRDTVTAQPQEQWFAELLSADGTVLATSGTTADIADNVTEDTWAGAIGTVTIADTATQIRITHAAIGATSANSVEPVCVAATEIVPPPVTPEIPPSSVTVTFQDEGPDASTISLDCGGASESATGRLVQLRLADLPGGSSCAIDYPAERVCDITSSPDGIGIAQVRDQLVVSIPAAGGVDIQVNIICRVTPVDPGQPAATTTTVAPATPTTTAAPVSPTTTVAAIVPEVESATATPQQANPAFTG